MSNSENLTKLRATIADILAQVDLKTCRYIKIESQLQQNQITDIAACCHGINMSGSNSSSNNTLGSVRHCKQCGFVI